MSDGLTIRQAKFAREYVKTGNGTRAAAKAGYTGSENTLAVTASRDLLRNPKVSAEVQALRNRLTERLDVSREKMLNDAAHIAEQAAANNEYGPAIKATELVMKAQGYLVERSLNLNADVTQQHLDALMQYTDQRIDRALDQRLGMVVEASASPQSSADVPTQHNVNDRISDVMESDAHVEGTDQRSAANPLTSLSNTGEGGKDDEAPQDG